MVMDIRGMRLMLLPMRGYRKKDGASNDGMNAAAMQQAALSKETLDWYKQQYAAEAPQREAAAAAASEASGVQLQVMRDQAEQSRVDREFQNSTFRPLEAKIV